MPVGLNAARILAVAAVAAFSFAVSWIGIWPSSNPATIAVVAISVCAAIYAANSLLNRITHPDGNSQTADTRNANAGTGSNRSHGLNEHTALFGQRNFERVFREDVEGMKNSLVIFSGFITPERVSACRDLFREKRSNGIAIRCVTRPPQYNGTILPERGKQALDLLEEIGVTVDCRRDIHQKVALIDGEIAWFGSLNPLSHAGSTDETMMRTCSTEFARKLAQQISLRAHTSISDLICAENPRCQKCSGRSYYYRDRFRKRAYFVCEAGCGWKEDARSFIGALNRGPAGNELQAVGPACPKCRSSTRLRRSRYGPFYSCSRYPRCKGKFDARKRPDCTHALT